MRALLATVVASGVTVALASGAADEKKVQMKDLPAVVQQVITEKSQGGTIRDLVVETEKGKRVYEAELRFGARTTDLIVDEHGTIVEFEEETTLDQIPAPARAVIEKAAVGGKTLGTVDKVTEGSTVFYEGHYLKGKKESEVKVDAAGRVLR